MRFAIGLTVAVLAIVLAAGATTRTEISHVQQHVYSFDETTVDSTGFTAVSDEVVVFGAGRVLGMRVCNTGADYALDGFQLVMKIDPDQSGFDTWLEGTDFDTATTVLRSVSTTGPHEIDTNGCAWAYVDCLGAYSVRANASAETHDTTVTVDFTVGAGQ